MKHMVFINGSDTVISYHSAIGGACVRVCAGVGGGGCRTSLYRIGLPGRLLITFLMSVTLL